MNVQRVHGDPEAVVDPPTAPAPIPTEVVTCENLLLVKTQSKMPSVDVPLMAPAVIATFPTNQQFETTDPNFD